MHVCYRLTPEQRCSCPATGGNTAELTCTLSIQGLADVCRASERKLFSNVRKHEHTVFVRPNDTTVQCARKSRKTAESQNQSLPARLKTNNPDLSHKWALGQLCPDGWAVVSRARNNVEDPYRAANTATVSTTTILLFWMSK